MMSKNDIDLCLNYVYQNEMFVVDCWICGKTKICFNLKEIVWICDDCKGDLLKDVKEGT